GHGSAAEDLTGGKFNRSVPIYEYQCSKCGKVFEVLQKFSDEPLKQHETCGGEVERLISASGFHLKGGGWYVTDYARAGSKREDSKKDEKPAATESKTESKSESTTAESKPAAAKTQTKDA